MAGTDNAAFIIRDANSDGEMEIRVFADGRVEGLPRPYIVVNRIPQIVSEAVAKDREER